jgi:hypothetical protein
MPERVLYPVCHDCGPRACRGLAFYTRHRMRPGESPLAADIVHLDGMVSEPGTFLHCGTCGQFMARPTYTDHYWRKGLKEGCKVPNAQDAARLVALFPEA